MPSKPTEDEPLIFGWRMPRREGRSLAFWMLMVLLGMAGFFYLFQVVYPQSQRFTPAPQQVLVLDPADPAARAVMSKMRDRDFMILPSDAQASAPAALDAMLPVFHPSFEKHEMQLQDLPHKVFTAPPARLLRFTEPVLPPLDLGDLKATPQPSSDQKSTAPQLVLKLEGAAARRTLIGKTDLSELMLTEPEAYRFQISVDRHGLVQFALSLESLNDDELTRQLTARLRQLRFKPDGQSPDGLDWGIAIFHWNGQP